MKKYIVILLYFLMFSNAHNAQAYDLSQVRIHGFVSQGYLVSSEYDYLLASTEEGTFQFNEMGINFAYMPLDSLRVSLQLLSRDLGEIGNNDVRIDYAFGDYRFRNWLGIRAGSIRMTHGLHNETRDIDALRTAVLLPQSIYSEDVRDFFSRIQGAGIYGEISMGRAGRLSYQVLMGTSDIDADSGVVKNIENSGMMDVRSVDEGVGYNGMIQWRTPLEGLRLVGTWVKMTDFEIHYETAMDMGPFVPAGTTLTDEMDNFRACVLSAEYIWGNLVVAAEYRETEINTYTPAIRYQRDYTSEGYYIGVSYRFADWLEMGSYYSLYYPDKNDRDGDRFETDRHRAWLKDFALSVRFDINDNWNFKLEGHAMDGTATLSMADAPDELERNWYLFASKLTFTF